MAKELDVSPKSYGVAVALCGIFGVMGVHHFYLREWLHGLADLGLFVLFVVFLLQENDGLAMLTLMLDVIHTVIVFYLLIIEKWRDGEGRLVVLK